MVATSFDDEREYDDERFLARTIYESEGLKAVCGFFEPGQFIPVHAPDSDVVVFVREGRGVVRDGDADRRVEPGDVVVVPAGDDRGVRATGGRLEALLVTAPPPGEAAHEPVRRGLRQGTFEPER